ncbi:MAG: PDDEXK nuclease domain-containing protein [Limisphaerales bacterium]
MNTPMNTPSKNEELLLNSIVKIIEQAKGQVASTVNSTLTLMYWHIGHEIYKQVLGNKRAEYGRRVIETLSNHLQRKYGTNEYSPRSLRRMMQFAQAFPDLQMVTPVVTQLSWTHFLLVLPLKDSVRREFYITMAASERWSKRELENRIGSMLYERTVISGKPKDFIQKELATLRNENRLSPDLVFKSPYFLDFTGLKGFYSERDLEGMLLSRLQEFILELGYGFSFVERQKRIIVDGEDYYIDLLFYHRKLRCLVAVELKKGHFKAEYKGQMELYLRYLDKYEKENGEESPLGLLLCAEGGKEQIELMQLDAVGIKIAQYLTELPDKQRLIEELRRQRQIVEAHFIEKKELEENSDSVD